MFIVSFLLACAAPPTEIPDDALLLDDFRLACAYYTAEDHAWDGFIRDNGEALGLDGTAAGAWFGAFLVPVTDGGIGCEPDNVTMQAEVAYADDLDEWVQTGAALLCTGPEQEERCAGSDYCEPLAQDVYYVPEEQDISACRAWIWDTVADE